MHRQETDTYFYIYIYIYIYNKALQIDTFLHTTSHRIFAHMFCLLKFNITPVLGQLAVLLLSIMVILRNNSSASDPSVHSSDDTMSLLGDERKLRLGDKGFRSPWVFAVCPRHFPWVTFEVLEELVGNMCAQEWLLLLVASDKHIGQEVMRTAHSAGTYLPGMEGSKLPSFKNTKAFVAAMNQSTDKALRSLRMTDIESRCNRYRDMVGALSRVDEEEPELTHLPTTSLQPQMAS